MPRVYEMSWDGPRARWVKMYKGKRYTIACSVLNAPPTKEGSYQAANAWWEAKKTEVDAADQSRVRPLLPLEDLIGAVLGNVRALDNPVTIADIWLSEAIRKREEAEAERRIDHSTIIDPETETIIEPEPDADPNAEKRAAIRALFLQLADRYILGGQPLPESMVNLLPPARTQQIRDSVAGLRGESTAPAERTNKAHADAWLSIQETMVAAGQITAARVNNVRMALAHFTRWLGETADVNSIDAAKLQGFYEYCLTQVADRRKDKKAGWSLPFAKEVFAVSRSWLRWLAEQGIIDPPRNLASRFRFGSTAKKIPTWTVDEVRHVIEEAPGKLKLALLLMVNCGMTQQDVSDLLDEEIDWTHGTITRRRSQTKHNENVPVVTYRLWPLTWQLLQQYRSGAERVLLTESGKPYVRNEMVNGKLKKADGFTSNYAHLKRRLKFDKPMKQLRKTAATLLESHEVYGRFKHYFLGHSPRSIADRYYAAPDQALFDKAIHWLGQKLGQVPIEDKPAHSAQQTKGRKKQANQ